MMTTTDKQARRRGRPPLVNRAKILEVAGEMDPDTITMQGLASKLGVDPKTLRNHITDRDSLMELLAGNALQAKLADTEIIAHADWRDAVRAYAAANRDAVAAMGALAGYVNFRGDAEPQILAPAEALLEALVDAGFDELTAGRILAFITEFTFTSARNLSARMTVGEHPQTPALQEALANPGASDLSVLRRVVEGEDHFDEAQFAFDLQLLILGMERLLTP